MGWSVLVDSGGVNLPILAVGNIVGKIPKVQNPQLFHLPLR